MLSNVKLKNFKSYKDEQSIPLNKLTLLFGPNGGGKSSVIQSIAALKEFLGYKTDEDSQSILSLNIPSYTDFVNFKSENNNNSNFDERNIYLKDNYTLKFSFNKSYDSFELNNEKNYKLKKYKSTFIIKIVTSKTPNLIFKEVVLIELDRKIINIVTDNDKLSIEENIVSNTENIIFKVELNEEYFNKETDKINVIPNLYQTKVFNYRHPFWFSDVLFDSVNFSNSNDDILGIINRELPIFDEIISNIESREYYPAYTFKSHRDVKENLISMISNKYDYITDNLKQNIKNPALDILLKYYDFKNDNNMYKKELKTYFSIPYDDSYSVILKLLDQYSAPFNKLFNSNIQFQKNEHKLSFIKNHRFKYIQENKLPLNNIGDSIQIPPLRKVPKRINNEELNKINESDIDSYLSLLNNPDEFFPIVNMILDNLAIGVNLNLIKENFHSGYVKSIKENKISETNKYFLETIESIFDLINKSYSIDSKAKIIFPILERIQYENYYIISELYNRHKLLCEKEEEYIHSDEEPSDSLINNIEINIKEINQELIIAISSINDWLNKNISDEIIKELTKYINEMLEKININDSNVNVSNIFYTPLKTLFHLIEKLNQNERQFGLVSDLYLRQSFDIHNKFDEITIHDKKADRLLRLHETGTGFSQLFPIIIHNAVNKDTLVTVEQPELHLHPGLQANLAKLFTYSTRVNYNQVILETHSEHLIKAVQLEIAKFHASNGKEGISKDDVSMVYISRNSETGASEVKEMRLDEAGSFIDPWPDDFFESSSDLTYERLKITHNN